MPRARKEIKLSPADEVRFWAKVNKSGQTMSHMDTPCWLWTAFKIQSGYGQYGGIAAHRIAWVLANGQIPHDGSAHGICVCHKCDVPACCNPEHLFLGTHADNMRDKGCKGRVNTPTGDKNGSRKHPEQLARGEANGSAKLTATQVMDIRALHAAGGITQHQLSVQFSVDPKSISRIIRRKCWRHL